MFSPASERNKAPILEVLKQHLPRHGAVLELACGSLQHAVYFAPHCPELQWIPTDIDPVALEHGQQLEDLPGNVTRPVYLDVLQHPWPVKSADVVYSANLLHISPAEVCANLFQGGAAVLREGDAPGTGQLFVYGPFKVDGKHTSTGNSQFDADLRTRDPRWGIRELEDVVATGASCGFELAEDIPMPANNRMLRFTLSS